MENNRDEEYTGTCPDCGAHITYEINYDSKPKGYASRFKHNAVIITQYGHFTPGKNVKRGTVSKEDVEKFFGELKTYRIKAPSDSLRKKSLENYLTDEINTIDTIEWKIID